MVIAFPLDHAQRIAVGGRDDAVLLYQSGLNVAVVYLECDGSAHSKEIPIYELRLAFGKRAAGRGPQPVSPREEDHRPPSISDAFRAFFDAMAGTDDRTPCA